MPWFVSVMSPLLLSACLVIAGCGYNLTLPTAISTPHGKGVREIPELSPLLQHPMRDLVIDMATYQTTSPALLPTATTSQGTAAPGTSAVVTNPQTRVVIQFDQGPGSLYLDVGIDGSYPHPLSLTTPCRAFLSITLDGQWGACWTQQGIATFRLPTDAASTPLAGQPLQEHLALPLSADRVGTYGPLAWDPTGRFLAIARRPLKSGITAAPLDIYAISPHFDQARLAVRFSVPCLISFLRWSSDGRWLLIATSAPTNSLYLVPLRQLVPSLPPPTMPEQLTVTLNEFVVTDEGAAWRPGTPAALLTWSDGGLIYQKDLVTGRTIKVGDLGFPPAKQMTGGIFSTAWTADGQRLIFALCAPPDAEFLGLTPRIFVYTLPGN